MYICDHMSLTSSYNEKCFRQIVGKVKTYISRSVTFFKIVLFMG